ncbi:MAG: hypothetical protein MUE83_14780 [Tabrizicola sp.]|jgi:hypothetical protein|nr:hypothetical protein [Tabrizicola sp.]
MAAGPGLAGVVTALLPLIGIVTMLRGRSRRKRGTPAPVDQAFEARQAATRESERRMAAYLAQRSSVGYQASEDDDEQEIRR